MARHWSHSSWILFRKKLDGKKVGVFGEKTVTLHFGSEVGVDADLYSLDNQPDDKPSAHIILE